MTPLRRAASITLTVLGLIAVVCGTVMMWVDHHVFDTEQVVGHAHSTLVDPSVQQMLRDELDKRITQEVGAQFAAPVDTAVGLVLADPRFVTIFDDAVRQTHRTLVAGDPDSIRFDLGAVMPVILEEVAAVDPLLASQFPDLSGALDIQLTTVGELPEVWSFVERFHRAAAALTIFGVLLIGLALVIGPSRWALLVVLGLAMVVSAVAVNAASGTIEDTVTHEIGNATTRQAAGIIADRFTNPLGTTMTNLMIAGGIVVLAGLAVRLLRPNRGSGRMGGQEWQQPSPGGGLPQGW